MSKERVMLLIDADNVSIDIVDQALQLLHKQHGGVHVRRAYCTAEGALRNQAAFKRLGIKPMVNLSTGKNSTDIALAVDAIDLVLAERPDVVVIASSDSDFAPLVQRLREKGCEVRGIGQHGKTGDETLDVYDDYTVLEHRRSAASAAVPARKAPARKSAAGSAAKPAAGATRARKTARTAAAEADAAPPAAAAPARKTTAARKAPARKAAEAVVPSDGDAAAAPAEAAPAARPARKTAAGKAPARKTAAGKTAQGRSARGSADAAEAAPAAAPESLPAPPPAAPPAVVLPAAAAPARSGTSIDAVLACLPELRAGQSLALNVAVQRLREAQLLGRNSSSLKLFSQLGERFELLPTGKPSQVRLR